MILKKVLNWEIEEEYEQCYQAQAHKDRISSKKYWAVVWNSNKFN